MRSQVLFVVVLVAACGNGGVNGSPESGATSTSSQDVTSTSSQEMPASTPTSAPAGTATTSSDGPSRETVIEWSRSGFDEGLMVSVTQLGHGFVGVVYDDLTGEGWPVGGGLYVSDDGKAWDHVESPIGDDEMVSFFPGSDWGAVGVVLSPEGRDQLDILLSDDGVEWLRANPTTDIGRAPDTAVPVSASWGPRGALAIFVTGLEDEQPESIVLFSDTGEEWIPVSMPDEAGLLRSVLVADSGYVIFEEPAEPGVPGFGGWFSEDGLSWEPVTIDNVIVSGSGGSTGWRDGFMVIRDVFDPSADTYGPVTWQSSDGRSWSEAPADPFEGLLSTGYEESLQGSSLGLILSAVSDHDHESDDPVENVDEYLLYSPDGLEWTRWNTTDTFGGNLGYYAISGETIVALISDMNSTDFQMTVWAASPGK